jgi:hypothetical protein
MSINKVEKKQKLNNLYFRSQIKEVIYMGDDIRSEEGRNGSQDRVEFSKKKTSLEL